MRTLLGAVAGLALAATSATATTIEDICPSNPTPPDPCVVAANIMVEDFSTIDAGTRTLVIAAGKTLQIEVDSDVSIRAAKIVLETGARIFGPSAYLDIRATGAPGVSGDILVGAGGAIDVSSSAAYANDFNGGQAGGLDIFAAGDFLADGDILLAGFGANEDYYGTGGDFYLNAAGTGRFNHIDTSGSPYGYFGIAYLEVDGPVTVNGNVDMTAGGWSGSAGLFILSQGDVVTHGTINLSVTFPEEAAGPVGIEGRNVTINGTILARGAAYPSEQFGGFGGALEVEATGDIDINADIVMPGAAGGGGGDVKLVAGGHIATRSFDLQGPGLYGSGGEMELRAQGDVSLGSIDMSGGEYGGFFQVIAAGSVTLGTLNAVATDGVQYDPTGGSIDVRSGATITVAGNVRARDAAGFGGKVRMNGCGVDVQAGAEIAAVVADLTAREQMTIAGAVHSDEFNAFRYRSGGPSPVIVGSVTPAPILVAMALTPCTSPSVCGNGTVESPEECDHGAANGTTGDSCSATCTEVMPALRIPGGGAKSIDCATEWSVRLGQVTVDGAGVPRNSQTCTDDDPACDADPTPGTCSFRVWVCVAGSDPRINCPASDVTSLEVRGPTGARGAPARVALVSALQAVDFPVAAGEQCSGRAAIDVPVKKTVKLKTRAELGTGKKDNDALRLKCLDF